MSKAWEGGLRPYRLEWWRETTEGVPATDVGRLVYSDNVRSFDPSGIVPGIEGQRGLTSGADFTDYFTGTGEFEISVEYDLQRALNQPGTAAAYDGLTRDTYENLPASHTIERRIEQGAIEATNTWNGTTSLDTRQYLVGLGMKADTVTIDGDPTSPQPVTVTIDYVGQKAEVHQIDQPPASETLTVAGLAGGNTITIEDESGTSEDLTADGTTSASFADVDAVYLAEGQDANVTVSGSPGVLTTIYGANAFDYNEGDQGVPPIGTGSHAPAVGGDYEIVQGDTFERPAATDLADEIGAFSITVENNVSADPSASAGPRPVVAANERVASADATVFGEVEYPTALVESMRANPGDLVWTLTSSTLTLPNSRVMSVGGEETPAQGIKSIDTTLQGTGVTVA